MADFMVLIRGGKRMEQNGLSGLQLEQHLKKWSQWITYLQSKGVVKEAKPLDKESRLLDSNGVITNTFFDCTDEMLAGYLVLSVANIDEAARLAQRCPELRNGATIEIRPINGRLPELLDNMRNLMSVSMN